MFKTLHFKSLFLLLCLIIGGSSSAWGEEFELYSGSLIEGDYIIYYNGYALKNSLSSSRFTNESVTPSNNIINTTNTAIVWHIAPNGDYWTIYNAAIEKYAGGSTTKNNGALLTEITDYALWSVTGNATYDFANKGRAGGSSNTGNKWLRNNGANGWAPYASSTGGALSLYKKKAVSVSSLDIKTAPTKTKYKINEMLDLTGLELDADGTSVTSGYTSDPVNNSKLSESGNKTIVISYGGQTVNLTISVGTLTSISFNTDFTNTTYTEKEYFNPEGLVVTAHYSNGIEEVVNNYTLNPSATTALETTNDKVTVSYTWANETKTVEIPITVNAGTKYTVSFDAQTGTCGTTFLNEASYQGGVTLPSATCSMAGWVFAGWAEAAVNNTTTKPILYAAGETYYPTEAKTLYAVYTLEETINKFVQATSNNDIYDGANVVISSLGNNKYTLANNNGTLTGISNFTPDNFNIITCTDSRAIWTLNANSTSYTINNNGKSIKRSTATLSLDNTGTNWSITKATTSGVTGDKFLVKDASYNYYIEHDGNDWKAYNASSPSANAINGYLGMTIYIASPTAYNSNPAGAIVDPVVKFEKGGTTLYLDGITTYTNAATVNEVNKTATYTSSNESVATVAADGTVTAMGIGTATITASVAQELGVNNAASASYDIVVKSATTIAGIKDITDASAAVNFTADLTDAIVTYVKDGHAYIQDATAAIYASCGSELTVGQKINGAVSGSVKAAYKIDEITSINLDEATVTNDGVIPTAEVKTLADIKAAATEYDGKLVKVNAATVSNSMANTANSGASISDDNGTTSFNLYAPNTGITVNASEIGNFTGFVSIYNGTTYRLNLYEQSQIVLTQNAARDQELSFDEYEIVLDEETTEFDNFIGQTVEGAQGTVTYAISGDDAIGTVDNDGIVVLNGTCGTATVTATAAAITKEINGIPTPFKTATKSYTIKVRPRYTVTFAINGIETEVREASYGAGVTAPTPAQIGEYSFVGWSTTEVATTDEEPTMATVANPSSNSEKYYAVFAKETIGNPETITLASNNGSNTTTNSITFAGTTNDNNGNSAPSFNLSKTLTISGIDLTDYSDVSVSFDYKVGKSGSTYTTFNVEQFNSSNSSIGNTPVTGINNNGWDNSNVSLNAACVKIVITSSGFTSNCYIDNIIITGTRPSITYAGYTTNPTQIAFGGSPESSYTFATFSSEQAVVFTGDVEVFAVTVDDANNLVKSELTKDDYLVENEGIVENGYYVPANTGVMVRGTANSYNYHIAATTEDVTIPTNMLIAGTDAVPTETDYKYYKLTYEDASHQHIGFYWGAAEGAPFMTKKGKAYLRLPKSVPARGFSLFDDDNTTTGISTMHNSEFIMHNEVYNLNGQRVENLKKGGLYIVNGKKMVIK